MDRNVPPLIHLLCCNLDCNHPPLLFPHLLPAPSSGRLFPFHVLLDLHVDLCNLYHVYRDLVALFLHRVHYVLRVHASRVFFHDL